MMQNNILFWLLISGHFIGDFYLQSENLVKKKSKILYLLLHGVIYSMAIFLILIPIINYRILIAFFIIIISHFIIDLVKILVLKNKKIKDYLIKNIFLIDQFIHIAIIISIAYFYEVDKTIALNFIGKTLLKVYWHLQLSLEPMEFIRMIFVFLVIGKPSNIFIKEINKKENIKLTILTDGESNVEHLQIGSEYQNAGKIIGTLERVIIVIMLIFKQYASIGLVLTAKSITRYDKISKEASFAEYYLVGTLLSVLIAILSLLIARPL